MNNWEWGVFPLEGTPKLRWGARAIVMTGKYAGIDIPYDRQCFTGNTDDPEKQQFMVWLNSEGIRELDECIADACKYAQNEVKYEKKSKDGKYIIHADTMNSGGYLYIGAWTL